MISVGDTVHVTDDALKMTTWKHRKEFKVTKVSYDKFGNQWVQGSALFEIWSANELEEYAMKFKVGDKVTIKSKAEIAKAYGGNTYDMPGHWTTDMDKYCGSIGEIIGFATFGAPRVKFSDGKCWYYGDKALTPAQSTVTITFNGDATTATDGEHTATVTKYHGDEYSEETGAIEAVKKLYHRFPQKGDRYYFVFISNKHTHVDFNNFDDDATDRGYRKSGNFYETKAAAQKVADKINAIFKEVH